MKRVKIGRSERGGRKNGGEMGQGIEKGEDGRGEEGGGREKGRKKGEREKRAEGVGVRRTNIDWAKNV